MLRQILLLTSLMLPGTAAVFGQTVAVSIPDTTAQKGDTLLIPIRILNLTAGDSVYSGEFQLSFDGGVIQIFDIDTAGTFGASVGSVLYNNTTRRLAFLSSGSEVTGNGVFVYLKTRALTSPTRDTTTISFSSAQFNEGSPGVSLTPGKFRILKMTLSPKNPPATLIVGDSLQFSVSGDQIGPMTWTSSDTAVGSIDASGKFKTKAAGQAKIFVEDSRGLRDSSNLFPVYPIQAASLTVSAPDTSYTQTLYFNMPVYVSDVTGLGIISAEFTMTFSNTRLQATDVILAGSMTADWSKSFTPVSGSVSVALAGAEPLSGSGILAYVRLRVLPAASGASAVSFTDILFNENLTANVDPGQFTPQPAPTVLVSPGTAQLVRDETLQFAVTSGGTPPYSWSSGNPSVASIDESTGLLTALARGTTTVSVTDGLGFVGTSGTVLVSDVRVSLPDTAVWPLDSIDVPIFADDVTGLGIYSYELRVVYDSLIAKFDSVVSAGTLSSGFLLTYKDTLDTLRIAAAGTSPLSGQGALLKLRFIPNSLPPSTGALTIVHCAFNEPGAGTPTAITVNGSLSVVEDVVEVPVLSSPSDDGTNVEINAALTWFSSTRATFYQVQLSLDPGFGSFVADTSYADTSFISPTALLLDTVYYWRVRAGNAGGTTAFSAPWSFRTVLITSISSVPSGIPSEFELTQNFPNPFNPTTNIRFGLPRESHVRVTAFDMAGNEIASVFSGVRQPGVHQITFDGANLSSGVYFYRLVATPLGNGAQSIVRTMKMILLK